MASTLFHHARRAGLLVLFVIGYTLAWLIYIVLGVIFGYGLEAED